MADLCGCLLLASAAPVTHLEFAMNIELEEVVVQDVSDDALELASGGAQEGLVGSFGGPTAAGCYGCPW
jgi:hypothetical protein